MTKFETPKGKEIQIVVVPKTSHLKIQFASGGELPEELTGLFTSPKQAEKVINTYLAKQIKDK